MNSGDFVTLLDTLTITRVANGWVARPGRGEAFVHVYLTPTSLANHVDAWARAQLSGPGKPAGKPDAETGKPGQTT